MEFVVVSEYFDRVEKVSSRLEITRLLAELFTQATSQEAQIIAYLALGNLNPVYVGTQFNIAEKSLVIVIARLLNCAVSDVEKRARHLGDLGLVVAEHERTTSLQKVLSITDVNKALHALHDVSGTGAQEKKEQRVFELFSSLDYTSVKYCIRIILGKLRLGFSDMTLLDAFSWMDKGDKSLRSRLEDAYNVVADIGYVAHVLKEGGEEALSHIKIVTGIPIRPAAAERMGTAAAIVKKIGPCIAQPKLDGFRLQLHVDIRKAQPAVHFYSRNLQDMSPMFPDLAHEATLLPVKELVAEGEAIAYDQETGTFLPFQETVKRRRKYGIDKVSSDIPLKLYLFDVLYVDGESMLEKTHEQRRDVLEKIVPKKKDGALVLIEEKKIETSEDLEAYFENTVSIGLEGLVVKKPNSPYRPGKRNFNWVKLKRQETGSLDDTLDCVILGYYVGHGKRASFGIGAFLVGVYNKHKDIFETVAKIGTGLTDAGWKELKIVCDKHAVARKPSNVVCVKELAPSVWVAPEVVCAIRADEITHSPLHSAGRTDTENGYALRFPRIMGYRDDKSPREATTVHEVRRLFSIQFNKKKKRSS